MEAETTTPQASAATPAVKTMGRKAFDAFLYELYGCEGKNDVAADFEIKGDDIYRVEVFNSPAGLMIAAHEMHRVHIIGPIVKPDGVDFIKGGPFPDEPPAFVEMTPEDEASIRIEAA